MTVTLAQHKISTQSLPSGALIKKELSSELNVLKSRLQKEAFFKIPLKHQIYHQGTMNVNETVSTDIKV